ncbi:MAG: F0F1 ATP synthase subunit epsilon [Melioribacteraceae bacterium]|nr:F0F1 ATP synthase subunit epsilon [Melioribacteraceae bacterium]WKZ70746.1 MAG: F0F1 ATP synthase subunit epsilon [Melioribacteraceae bacterium]
MKELNLEVITPSKKAYSGKIQSITLPGTLGSFQVLFNHAPILSSLEIGEIKIVDSSSNVSHYAVGGGTVEVLDNNVLVLAESFEDPADIDDKRAEAARERAKERLKSHSHEVDDLRAEVALKRAINRLNVKKKYF